MSIVRAKYERGAALMLTALIALWLVGWLTLLRIPLYRRDPARTAYAID